MTTTNSNPRGYAYTVLSKAWTRQLGWRPFAAAAKYGYYPTLGDYIDQGLAMFDDMYDDDIAVIGTIVAEMGRSIKATMYGHITESEDENGDPKYSPKYDVTLNETVAYDNGEHTRLDLVPQVEQGYADVEDADLMRYRMRIISERINEEDFKALQSFVQGDADTIYALFDGDNTKRLLFLRRMKAQLGSLNGALVFG